MLSRIEGCFSRYLGDILEYSNYTRVHLYTGVSCTFTSLGIASICRYAASKRHGYQRGDSYVDFIAWQIFPQAGSIYRDGAAWRSLCEKPRPVESREEKEETEGGQPGETRVARMP